ncbi:MAG TPA: trypsin-like peptidase domain-containing protein [Alphaproteobacteria bacterium]|nr:trypsin-like peptidase domain-containing protein [Alphaproteobacteria bacterium]
MKNVLAFIGLVALGLVAGLYGMAGYGGYSFSFSWQKNAAVPMPQPSIPLFTGPESVPVKTTKATSPSQAILEDLHSSTFDILSTSCIPAIAEANRRAVTLYVPGSSDSFTGSGIMLDSDYLLTAAHVLVEKNETVTAVLASDPFKRWESPALLIGAIPLPRPRPEAGQKPTATVYRLPRVSDNQLVALDLEADLALLKLIRVPPSLGRFQPVKVSSGITGSDTLALVSSVQSSTRVAEVQSFRGNQVILDPIVVQGDSGSGVFDCKNGMLAGIAVTNQPIDMAFAGLAENESYPILRSGGIVAPMVLSLFLQKHWPNYGK